MKSSPPHRRQYYFFVLRSVVSEAKHNNDPVFDDFTAMNDYEQYALVQTSFSTSNQNNKYDIKQSRRYCK